MSSYLTDITARSHREDLQREASAVHSARRARRSNGRTQSNDYGETRRNQGRVHSTWNWFATAQL